MANPSKPSNRMSVSLRSDIDFERIIRLSEMMGCSISTVGSMAIEQWLHDNYFKYKEYYSREG